MGVTVTAGPRVVGLGDVGAPLCVYIANRPPLQCYESLDGLQALAEDEVAYIAAQTGNHWRKIFNCYAKLGYQLDPQGFSRWQDYRDQYLLQAGSGQALLFSPPQPSEEVSIVMGKSYAEQLRGQGMSVQGLVWVDGVFAISRPQRLIICPYFDYRQLTNARIVQLVSLVESLNEPKRKIR